MTPRFPADVVSAVVGHMNSDHPEDNLLIVRAFGGAPDAASARMADFDADAGTWVARSADRTESAVRVPWPAGPIAERREVRREVVALYDEACRRLGVAPRPHS